MLDKPLNITDCEGQIVLADGFLTRDSARSYVLCCYCPEETVGITPVWRTRERQESAYSRGLMALRALEPTLEQVLAAFASIMYLRPDDIALQAQQIAKLSSKNIAATQLRLALATLVSVGLLAKRYTVVDPRTGRTASELFETLDKIPSVLDDTCLGEFTVSTGNVVDVYERIT